MHNSLLEVGGVWVEAGSCSYPASNIPKHRHINYQAAYIIASHPYIPFKEIFKNEGVSFISDAYSLVKNFENNPPDPNIYNQPNNPQSDLYHILEPFEYCGIFYKELFDHPPDIITDEWLWEHRYYRYRIA
ncbi:MAG: hypothetical protein EF806_04585 [Candidatus Methanoliparum thermophilum]|uniref:Uncharacterized protein n=1 Tax=Methanoliparum thermophilum TaxID=2491083 RepID=A0A520KS54_METT2|nr:MAG: hypothetical protein EF806_04585 [Candidatus Methanoliparum thermophilum]